MKAQLRGDPMAATTKWPDRRFHITDVLLLGAMALTTLSLAWLAWVRL